MRGHSLPHGLGPRHKAKRDRSGKRNFPVDRLFAVWDQVTDVSRFRSLIPIQKSRLARRLFRFLGAMCGRITPVDVTAGPALIWPCRATGHARARTRNPSAVHQPNSVWQIAPGDNQSSWIDGIRKAPVWNIRFLSIPQKPLDGRSAPLRRPFFLWTNGLSPLPAGLRVN